MGIWGIAKLVGVSPALLSALCFVESGHNVAAYVKHDGGSPSYGQCQIKEATARELGFNAHRSWLMQPDINAYYAAKYLAKQKKRFGSWERAVSAYNAGRPIKGNRPYVDKVMRIYRGKHGRSKEEVFAGL